MGRKSKSIMYFIGMSRNINCYYFYHKMIDDDNCCELCMKINEPFETTLL